MTTGAKRAAGLRWSGFVAVLGCTLVVMGAPSARAMELTPAMSDLYASVSAYPPTLQRMTVCYGFGCRRRQIIEFNANDRSALTRIMASGRKSAQAERAALQQAVVWFDKRVGPIIGTDKRIANADIRHRADATNYDCWDTTRNVTALLLMVRDLKLLRHHRVTDPVYRGNALMLQTPHNAPTVTETATKVSWTVDMWTRGYAQLPEVMTADVWKTLQ